MKDYFFLDLSEEEKKNIKSYKQSLSLLIKKMMFEEKVIEIFLTEKFDKNIERKTTRIQKKKDLIDNIQKLNQFTQEKFNRKLNITEVFRLLSFYKTKKY